MPWAFSWSLVALLQCSNSDEKKADEGCTPGQTQHCLGPGACEGAQVCLANGTGFGACDCGSSAGGTGGLGGAAGTSASGSSGSGGGGSGGASSDGGDPDGAGGSGDSGISAVYGYGFGPTVTPAALALLQNDELVIAASISGPVDFGNGVVAPTRPGVAAVLLRRRADGSHVSATLLPSSGVTHVAARDQAFALAGRAFMSVSSTEVTQEYPCAPRPVVTPLLTTYDLLYVSAHDPDAKCRWSKSVSSFTRGSSVTLSVAVDRDGIVIASYYGAAPGFPTGLALTQARPEGGTAGAEWTIAWNAAGELLWQKPIAGTVLAADGSGNVYLSGPLRAPTDFGGGNVSGSHFIAKLGPTGEHLFSKGLDVGGDTIELSADASRVFLSGTLQRSGSIAGVPVAYDFPQPGGHLTLFDGSLAHIATRVAEGWRSDSGQLLTPRLRGAVTGGAVGVAGHFLRRLELSSEVLNANGTGNDDSDVVFGFSDANAGSFRLAKFGASGSDRLADLGVDSTGALILIGTYSQPDRLPGSIELPVPTAGPFMFLAKLAK